MRRHRLGNCGWIGWRLALDEGGEMKKQTRLKPGFDDEYYTLDFSWRGLVARRSYWTNDEDDLTRWNDHNVFRTKREAQAALKRVKKALKG